MPQIKIHRKLDWTTLLKPMELYIDDQKIGRIDNGGTRELEVSPGLHRIRAKMTWVGSRELQFTMFNKESKEFSVGRNNGLLLFFLVIIFVPALLQHIYPHKQEPSLIIGFLPIAIILLTLVTIGKNSYLSIKEIAKNK